MIFIVFVFRNIPQIFQLIRERTFEILYSDIQKISEDPFKNSIKRGPPYIYLSVIPIISKKISPPSSLRSHFTLSKIPSESTSEKDHVYRNNRFNVPSHRDYRLAIIIPSFPSQYIQALVSQLDLVIIGTL